LKSLILGILGNLDILGIITGLSPICLHDMKSPTFIKEH
jgi:hypothetical protein